MIYRVTNLNDSGAGSLRAALEASGFRVVVFDVAGTVELVSQIMIRNPNIEVRGQTAPGGGICVKGGYIAIEAADVTLRYLRLRPGATDEVDALQINAPARRVLIDHCSLSWAVDENLDLYGNIHDIVIRHCIISEGLNDAGHSKGPHSMGALVGGGADRVLFERCLFGHNNQRNPLVASGRADVVNCVMYGEGILFHCSGDPRWPDTRVNFIGNYQGFPAAETDRLQNYIWWYEDGVVQVYEHDTEIDGYDGPPLRLLDGYPGTVEDHLEDVPFPPLYGGEPLSAMDALADVLANAGATLPQRDMVDARIVADVQNGTGGIIDDPADVGGWPDLTVYSPNQTWAHRSRACTSA